MNSSPKNDLINKVGGAQKGWLRSNTLAIATIVGAGLVGATLLQAPKSAIAEPNARGYDSVNTAFGRAPLSFADLVDRVKPAVVSVHVKSGTKEGQSPELFKGLPEDHPLREFFKKFGGKPELPQRRSPALSQGAGFIISADGYVVTNHHVAGNADQIEVTLDNGDKLPADLIGSDKRTDLALLKIKTKRQFEFVKFSNKEARVGDWVLAVGNPFGLGGTVTAGIVSARGRDIGNSPYDFLQIDAAVNKGNSGGPAFNLDGEVVGVNTAIWSPSGGNVGIAFAVPADLTRKVIDQLKSEGSVSRGWLGVTIQDVTEDIAASIGIDDPAGALVTKITVDGPAAKSDLKVGDAIVDVNGERIDDSRDLARTIAELSPNTDAQIAVYRNGDKKSLRVKLGRFPGEDKLAKLSGKKTTPSPEKEMKELGLSLAPGSTIPGMDDDGVVITKVDPDSKAAEKGLKAGDVVVAVGGAKVKFPKDVVSGVRKAKKEGRKAVLLQVKSGERQRFIGLPLGKKG